MKPQQNLTTRWRSLVFSLLLALSFFALAQQSAQAQAAPGDWAGWPSADETDGKFLDISGPVFQVQYIPYRFFVGIPSDATTFDIEIFDGDADFGMTGHYDVVFTNDLFTYNLFQDPLKDGAGTTAVATKSSADFTDNAWAAMVTGQAVEAGAQAPTGHYFYRLEITFDGDPNTEPFLNGFKVRVRGNSPTTQAQLSVFQEVTVVGAPINIFNDPAMGTPGNTYDGDWHYYVHLPEPQPSLDFTDGDADYRLDGDTTPNPADDSSDVLVRVSPDIRYEIIHPNSTQIVLNTDPSGNLETETYTYAPVGGAPSGIYDWHWFGADAGNTTFIRTEFEMFANPVENPLPTPITLGYFKAEAGVNPGDVGFVWQTVTEVGNLGFNLYARKAEGKWRTVNPELIPSQLGDSVETQSYSYSAYGVTGREFALGDVDVFGKETIHGPFPLGATQGVDRSNRQATDWKAIKTEHKAKHKLRKAQRAQRMDRKLQRQLDQEEQQIRNQQQRSRNLRRQQGRSTPR